VTGNAIDTVYVVGGTSQVSAATLTSLQGLSGVTSATRIVDDMDEYIRSADFATWALANVPGTTAKLVGITSGENFPDGLGASASVGSNNGVLLLTEKAVLSDPASGFLTAHKADVSTVIIYGGTGAVSGNVFEDIYNIFNP
jgi:hypothetical protein